MFSEVVQRKTAGWKICRFLYGIDFPLYSGREIGSDIRKTERQQDKNLDKILNRY